MIGISLTAVSGTTVIPAGWGNDINDHVYGSLITIASHATTAAIWADGITWIDWTGTATTTAFPAATVVGDSRILKCAGACSFTAGANMLIQGVPSGSTTIMVANDTVTILSVTLTQFLITIDRYSPVVDDEIKSITATVGSNQLTAGLVAGDSLTFRSATLGSGAVTSIVASPSSIIVPSTATLGTVSAVQSRLILLAINNASVVELAIVNQSVGTNLDETTLLTTNSISTVATGTGEIAITTGVLTISGVPTGTWQVGMVIAGTNVPARTYITSLGTGSGGAGTYNTNITSAVAPTAMNGFAGVGIYSTVARTSVPFRVVGYIESTQSTAGTWATAPSTIQGYGGQALATMSSLGYGQTWQNVISGKVIGTNYTNTTGRPIAVSVAAYSDGGNTPTMTIAGVTFNGTQPFASIYGGSVFGIVPAGALYRFDMAGVSVLQIWAELR